MVKRFQKKIGIPSKNNDEKEKFLRHKQTQKNRKGKSGHFYFQNRQQLCNWQIFLLYRVHHKEYLDNMK